MKLLVKDPKIIKIFDAFPFGVLILDEGAKIVELNRVALKILNAKRENVIGKIIFPFFLAKKDIENYIFNSNNTSTKVFSTKDEKRYLEATKSKIKNTKGMLLTLKDVTDFINEKKHHEETEEKIIKLALIPEQNPNPIFEMDINGKILYKNPAAKKLFGFSKNDSVEKIIIRDLNKIINKLNKKKKCATKEFKLNNLIFEFNICYISNNFVRIFAHDITARKESEQRRDYFVGMVSHELKGPLTNIKAFTQLLQNKYKNILDNKGNYFLEKIDIQTDKITRLINELLDVVKIRSGKIEFHKELFDFNQLLEEEIENFKRVNKNHKIIKKGRVERKIYADKQRIGQVILNLMSNAIKYSPESDRVEINVKRENNNMLLIVKDYGIGIKKDLRGEIFQPFFRINEQVSGVGLGLYISNEIIRAHKGKIEVESEEGKGSTFTVILPFLNK